MGLVEKSSEEGVICKKVSITAQEKERTKRCDPYSRWGGKFVRYICCNEEKYEI